MEEGASESVGLADVMAKILRSTKPKKSISKTIILSRAKKDTPVNAETNSKDFNEDGNPEEKPTKRRKTKHLETRLENINRVKPDPISGIQLERQLTKIATKGVVQLFNAVSVQQKISNIKKESKHSKNKLKSKTENIQEFDKIISKSNDTVDL